MMTLFDQEYAVERYGDEKKPREKHKDWQREKHKDWQKGR